MAATDKNMTFDVNLLPATTGDHNLGSSNLKWNLYVNDFNGNVKANSIIPIMTRTFTSGKYGQDGSGTHYYETLGSITPATFDKMWLLRYVISIEVSGDSTYTYRSDVSFYGVRNTYGAYKIFNSYYNKYPIYQHALIEGASSSYPHEFGYRLASSSGDTTVIKNIQIDIIEMQNCEVAFFDAPKAYTSTAPTNYTIRTFNAISNGMQETGDDNTITRLYAGNNTMTVGSTFRLAGSSLFGFDKENYAQGISLYNSGYTSNTTSINTARVYNSAGFDWTKGLFYNTGGNYNISTNIYPGIDQSIHAIDFRYTDNCVNSSSLTTLGLERYKPVYFRGTIGVDGLFYLAPLTVSYNNQNYTRAWTQDIPTSADGYVYWFLGFPYYNSSYAGGYQLNFYLENKLFWYHNGKFQEYIGDAVTVNGHTINKDVPSDAKFTDNNTTYTFENGTNGFKVTPLGGTAQTVTVTPSITNNVTGSGISGYLAKFNGTNTITTGPQLGSSTTTFLRNDGTWATALTSHQDISGKVNKNGDTMTGNLVAPSIRIANTYYGITFGRTTSTPVETILHTGIKWVSGRHMPVIHITGYAYGLQSPVEFKIGFYIYNNKIGYCGVTNMGAWQPNVFLFKDTHDSDDYVGVGLAGSCYFLQLQADLQDEMGKFGYTDIDSSKWSWTFSTSTGVIPAADDGTTCAQVPYKANILNPSKVNGHTVEANVPSNAKFTDTTDLTSMTGTLAIDHGGTNATTAAGARTNLGLGSWALKSSGTGSDVGLGNVENTKLSTWTGTSNIKTVGTITSGTWNGAAIAASYIGNHSTDKLTSGTLPVARGGTGQTSIADIKTAINYGVTGQEVSINSGANNTNQNLQLCWTVVNSNSNLNNKKLTLVVSSSSISLYDSTDSTSVWTALSNKNLVTVAQGGTGTATAASNTVFAGPSSGSAAAPSFRALTTNDIPSLAASKITSGTFDTARIPTNISITGSAGISTVGTRIRTELTKGTNPSSTAWQSAWYNYQTGTGTDIADRIGGGIESYVNSSGLSAICLRAYKYAANSTETNSLEIQIAKDGTLSYSISSPQAFRQALGLGSNATSSTAYLPTTGGTVSGQLILSSATDVAGNAASESALIIGSKTGTHLALDGNEIMAKTDATSVGTLNINYDGGDVAIGAANTSYAVNIRSTKASSSSSTGALTIGGGIGAGGNIYSGANIYATRLLYAGFSTSTTEQQTGVASKSGSLYLYSTGNESGNGNRGLHAPAHGTGAATTIIQVDTNNNVTFNGSLSWSNITNRPANAGSEDIPIYWSNNEAVATNFSCTDQNYNDQLFAIWRQLDTRSYNTEYSEHKLGLVIAPTGIFCYDKTSSETIWSWKQDSNSKWVSDRATVLDTAREIYVNLSTTRDANNKVTFDGSADKAIHVSGTLPIARGGTGSSTAAANTVFAGPSSGSTTAPSFRALTTSDIPNLAASKITSGVFDAARIPTDINISGAVIKNTSLVKGTNPSAETWQTLWLNYQNENEENIQDRVGGNIQSKVTTTGSTVTYIRAYQFTANSTVSNNFGVGIAKDGTMSYEISDPAKFRAALGLGSNATSSTAYLPLSSGTLDSYYLNIKPTSTGSSPWITFTFGNNTTSSNGYSTYNNYHTYRGDWNIMLFANRYELNNAWSGARMFFRSYSAKANSGERLNFYEEYRLPMASDGLSANAPYNILTTKNFNFFTKTVTKTPYNGNVDLEIGYDYYVLSIYNSTYSSSTRYIWVPFTPDDNYSTWWAHGMKNDSTHAVPTGSQTLTILYMKCTPY